MDENEKPLTMSDYEQVSANEHSPEIGIIDPTLVVATDESVEQDESQEEPDESAEKKPVDKKHRDALKKEYREAKRSGDDERADELKAEIEALKNG